MGRSYYVYVYCDPRKDFIDDELKCGKQPFYVGKGSGSRAYVHLKHNKEVREKNRFKYWKIQKIRKETGADPIIEIMPMPSETDALFVEERLIKKWGRKSLEKNGILTNFSRGGEKGGHPMSAATRQKLSMTKTGKPQPWNVGRILSAEARQKISIANKGSSHSQMCAKRYRIKNMSSGEIFDIENLTKWCLKQREEIGVKLKPDRLSGTFKSQITYKNFIVLGIERIIF